MQILRGAGLAEETDLDVSAYRPPLQKYRGVKWIGGNAKLVQTGDLVDRGDYGRDLYALFAELRRQAPLQGGEVVNLLGNHELMNLMGDLRYVSRGDYEAFGGAEMRKLAWHPQGEVGKQLLEEYQAVALLDGTLFAHAGVTPKYAAAGVDALNAEALRVIRDATEATQALHDQGREGPPRLGADGAVLKDKGPFWVRQFAMSGEAAMCPMLEEALSSIGADRLFIGHTQVDEGRVRPRCDGKLLMADTIISRNGYPQCWQEGAMDRYGCAASRTYVELRRGEAFSVTVQEDADSGSLWLEEAPLPSLRPSATEL